MSDSEYRQMYKYMYGGVNQQQPDCTQDMSCHNSKNWPQRNGNKRTLELKINCAWNNQDDAGQTTKDQFEDDC